MFTKNKLEAPSSHFTPTMRSLWCVCKSSALTQSARCTEIPLPRVMNPMIGSPGTGVQQRASFTKTSSIPSTLIALLERLATGAPPGTKSIVGSG